MEFNKEQLEAIQFKDGACAVIAAAGSGKSTVLTERCYYLHNNYNVSQSNIVVLSFTDAAKQNMIKKLQEKRLYNITVHTFHSLCSYILYNENYPCNLFDESKDRYKVTQEFRNYNKKFTNAEINNIFNFINYQKKYGLSYNDKFVDYEIMIDKSDMKKCFKIYEDYKDKNNLTDFEDWIITAIKILKESSKSNKYTYDYLMIDEHQDSNLIQNTLIKLLCPKKNIFCVFDYRQSIFGFSGANSEYCMNFDKEYKNSKVINLDTNYRSCDNIVENANKFIKLYYGDYEHYSDSISNIKNNGNINLITSNSREAEAIEIFNKIKELTNNGKKLEDICILYRLNSNSDYIVKLFKDNNIIYNIKSDASFFKRKEVNLVISVLRLVEDTNDNEAFEKLYSLRAYNLHMFSKKDLEKLKTYAGRYNLNLFQSLTAIKLDKPWQNEYIKSFINNIEKLRYQKDKGIELIKIIENIYNLFNMNWYIKSNWETSQQDERKDSLDALKEFAKRSDIKSFLKFANGENKNSGNKDGISLMTIHSSKGLEYDTVFIIGIEDGKFPHERNDILEEARIFYVGITRAKENLYISQIYENNKFVKEYFS